MGALELGGSHVAAALVDPGSLELVDSSRRRAGLEPELSPEGVLTTLESVARSLPGREVTTWTLAVPGPFDYERGIALFEAVGKFDVLHGLDVRSALAARLDLPAESVMFVNDADAFLVGALAGGALSGHVRCAGLTLGTGVGSAFAVDGRPVPEVESVIPGGRAHHLELDGRALEDVVSTRAVIAAYRSATGRWVDGVKEVADRARRGEQAARGAIDDALVALGRLMRPLLDRFGATALVVGGSMTRSWDVVEPPLRRGLDEAGRGVWPVLVPELDTEGRALVGAVAARLSPEHTRAGTTAGSGR